MDVFGESNSTLPRFCLLPFSVLCYDSIEDRIAREERKEGSCEMRKMLRVQRSPALVSAGYVTIGSSLYWGQDRRGLV